LRYLLILLVLIIFQLFLHNFLRIAYLFKTCFSKSLKCCSILFPMAS